MKNEHKGWNEINGKIIEELKADNGLFKHHCGGGPCQTGGEIFESYQLLDNEGKAVANVRIENGQFHHERGTKTFSNPIAAIFFDQWLNQLVESWRDRELKLHA